MLTLGLICFLGFIGYKIYKDPLGSGIIYFLFYLQFSGFLKRLLLYFEPGVIQIVGYNFIVGIQYLLFSCILVSSIRKDALNRITKSSIFFSVGITFLFLVSISQSRFSIGLCLILLVLNFFPMLSFYIGKAISAETFQRILKFLFFTSFIHVFYCFYQFFFGPFAFEMFFLEDKSSLVDVSTGDFFRSVPLYDNIEPLYVHFLVVFAFASPAGNPFSLSKKSAWIYRFLIFLAILVMGNRSGLMLLGFVLLFEIYKNTLARKAVFYTGVFFIIISLNIFYKALFSVIDDTTIELVSNSDFSTRLGTLGTFSDRLVGRKNATEQANLLGHGLGSSGLITAVFENKYNSVPNTGADFKNHFIWAHDLIGEMLIDFGLLGTAFFLFFILRNTYSIKENNEASFQIVLSLFLVSCLIGSSLFIGRSAYLLFLIMGHHIKRPVNEE